MKRISITLVPIIVGTALFIASLGYTQEEKLTEEQAVALIEEYKVREQTAAEKIKEEEAKISALQGEIAALDAQIAFLTEEITKLKATPKYSIYRVRPGDWLAKLAEYPEVYGHGYYALWRVIYDANRELIRNPNLIYPGWELKVPLLSEEEKSVKNREIMSRLRR